MLDSPARRAARRSDPRPGGYSPGRIAILGALWILGVFAISEGALAQTPPDVGRSVEPVAAEDLDHRLLLIGDAGAPDPDGEPALFVLNARAGAIPSRTTAVFLGDNIYETGMPDDTALEGTDTEEVLDEVLLNLFESRQEAEKRFDAQVQAVLDAGARAYFVPGNHDWDQFGVGGWERVRALGAYVDTLRTEVGPDVAIVPRGGCPGPEFLDLGSTLRLIALDTQWWLDAGIGGKPGPDENPTGCEYLTEESVAVGLERQLIAAGRRHTVVVAHHPIRTHGPHGGYYPVASHLFPIRMFSSYVPKLLHWVPVPVVGSAIVGLRRWRSPTVQDLSNPRYQELRSQLMNSMEAAAAAGHEPLLFAAGHDHSLQLFREPTGPAYSLVSGLGSSKKASAVSYGKHTLFAHSSGERPGLIQLDFARDGRVRVGVFVWEPSTEEPVELYSRWLERANGDLASRAPGTAPRRIAPPLSTARQTPPTRVTTTAPLQNPGRPHPSRD